LKICGKYQTPDEIPAKHSQDRTALVIDLVNLVDWYGSNAIAYGIRRLRKRTEKQYSEIVRDVSEVLRKRFPKKRRPDLPRVIAVKETEELIAKMLIDLAFYSKSTEEIAQTLHESGLEEDAARDAAKKYGPGLSGVGLPVLAKLLGKKTVTVMVEQITVALTYKFIGKEAAKALAKRLVIKFSQKLITRIVSLIGWLLVGFDITMFIISPARRITTKAIPYIALLRVRRQLDESED
jgi:hypothetical protein